MNRSAQIRTGRITLAGSVSDCWYCTTGQMRYCQQFHPRKSQIVWFNRQQNFIPPVSFSLGSFVLTIAPTYRYLGFYLDANFSWKTHCKQLMVKPQYDAYCVRRVIDFEIDASIHFSSVWLLCLIYLLPRWTYGAPFIRTIDLWPHRLQSLIASVIRKVLALPISTNMLSVLVDANLLPLRTFNQYHILRTANKMASLPATHNTNKLFTHNYNMSAQRRHQGQLGARVRSQPAKIRTYTDNLLQLEHDWQCHHTDDVSIINQKAREYVKVEWHDESHYGLVLKSVKTQCARSEYRYLANRADKRMIARFRHNRILVTMNRCIE